MPRQGLVDLGPIGALFRVAPYLTRSFVVTIEFTVVAAIFGLAVGLIIALLKMSRYRPFKVLGTLYTWFFRGTPLLVQIFLVYFGLPQYGINLPPFLAGALALSLNSGAYLSEIIRAGIESIPVGQMEAARSMGMSYGLAMRRVIIPQAYRRMLPPIVNEFVALLKDSSLVSVIGAVELMLASRQLSSATARPFWFYTYAAVYYLIGTSVFTQLGTWLERRLKDYE